MKKKIECENCTRILDISEDTGDYAYCPHCGKANFICKGDKDE